jgi:hypothetical protein
MLQILTPDLVAGNLCDRARSGFQSGRTRGREVQIISKQRREQQLSAHRHFVEIWTGIDFLIGGSLMYPS